MRQTQCPGPLAWLLASGTAPLSSGCHRVSGCVASADTVVPVGDWKSKTKGPGCWAAGERSAPGRRRPVPLCLCLCVRTQQREQSPMSRPPLMRSPMPWTSAHLLTSFSPYHGHRPPLQTQSRGAQDSTGECGGTRFCLGWADTTGLPSGGFQGSHSPLAPSPGATLPPASSPPQQCWLWGRVSAKRGGPYPGGGAGPPTLTLTLTLRESESGRRPRGLRLWSG